MTVDRVGPITVQMRNAMFMRWPGIHVYHNVHTRQVEGGTAWSRDGGQSWQRADTGRDRHYTWGLAVSYDDPDCWYISACPGPREAHNPRGNAQAYIYRWRGYGPWQALGGGLPHPLKSFPYALASVPGRLYVGLGNGEMYMSYDEGDTWQKMTIHGDSLAGISAILIT